MAFKGGWLRLSEPVSYYPFRKTDQGVLVIGEVKETKPKGNRLTAA